MRFEVKPEYFPGPDGGLVFTRTPWDSELFGFPFYDLKCAETGPDNLARHLEAWLKSISGAGKCLVVARLACSEIELSKILARHAFYPIETLIEIRLPLARFKPLVARRFANLRMELAVEKDLPELTAIAGAAFAADRFHLDRYIPAEKADLRYANWIREGYLAGDRIFVLKDERVKRAAGFVLARESKPGIYDMSLAALDRKYQQSGAGVFLYQAMLVESKKLGCKMAVAWISINNLNSLKAAERLGFVTHSAVTKFHWFHAAAEPRPKSNFESRNPKQMQK